jgi:DNA polymerase
MISAQAEDFVSFRATARTLLAAGVPPDQVAWGDSLFASSPDLPNEANPVAVPRDFLQLAETVALHRDPVKWPLLYRVLYRLTHGERNLLKVDVDDDVRALLLMEKALRRDVHKMTAFVRFRRVRDAEPEYFVAWHRPDHYIMERMAPWFRNRFGSFRWSILTPDRSAHWDLANLTFGPGVPRSDAPDEDALEDLWRDYYRSIFNPARVKVKAMKAEMPVRHWATLPETQIIGNLLDHWELADGSRRASVEDGKRAEGVGGGLCS